MRHRLEYLVVASVRAAVRWLPRALVHSCGTLLGLSFYAVDGVHRRIALANLQAAFPVRRSAERRAIARAMFGHFGRVLVELLKFSTYSRRRMMQLVEFDGEERVRLAYAQRKGVLFFTGHFGFWEQHAIAHALKFEPIAVLARALDNPRLNRLLEQVRGCTGNTVIYRRGAVRRVMRTLAAGHGVALLIDQHLQEPEALHVDFFERPAATTSALGALALRTGASVIPVFALPIGRGRYRMIYEHPVEPPQAETPDAIREFTQRCTDVLEMYVRRHPQLWLWMHRRWREVGPSEQAPGMFPAASGNGAEGPESSDSSDSGDSGDSGDGRDGAESAEDAEVAERMTADGSFRRIVVFSPNWLGDAVMALPALADVRRDFPAARLAIAARRPLAPLFRLVPGVDEVVPIDERKTMLAWARWRDDVRAVAAGEFDLAILFPNSFFAAWVAARAQVRERWGYRRDFRTALLTRGVGRPRGRIHQAAYYQELVKRLGVANGPLTARLPVTTELVERAHILLEREGLPPDTTLVGIAPGAAYGHAKRWPPLRVAELIDRLTGAGVACVLLGSAADRGIGQEVAMRLAALGAGRSSGSLDSEESRSRATRAPWMNLIGRTDLPLLAGVMSRCGAFVSNDSGAMHLAAAIGVSVTAIFGPTNEGATGPLPDGSGHADHVILTSPVWCRPCMLRECPIDHRCMTRITAAQVGDAVSRQLAAGSRQ